MESKAAAAGGLKAHGAPPPVNYRTRSRMTARRRVSMADHEDAPGLYKWLVVLSAFMLQIGGLEVSGICTQLGYASMLSSGVTYCVGVFYVMFRQNLGGSSSVISFVSSLNTCFFFGVGPVAGAIVRRYGCRWVAVSGSVIGALGLTITSFASEPWHLILTFGIISGLGMGLSYIPCISVIGHYFGRRRSLAMGMSVTGLGMGPIVFPPFLRVLEKHFGWRGAMLLVSGLYLQSVVFAALLRPREEKPKRAFKSNIYKEKTLQDTKLPVSSWESDLGDPPRTMCMIIKRSCLSYIAMFGNMPLTLFCIQNVVFSFGLSVINVHIGAYAISQGFSTDQAAMLFFSMSVGSAISRVLYGIILQLTSMTSSFLYALTTALCGVFTITYPFGDTYIALVAVTAVIGVFFGSYGSIPPLITIDIIGVELLPSAYGMVCVADGIGFLLGGPVAGWLYDNTANYPASFYLGGGSMVSSGILMVTIWTMLRQRTLPQTTKSTDKKTSSNC